MAFRNISVLLTANSASLRSNLIAASRAVDQFTNKVESHHKGVTSSSKIMEAAVIGGAAAIAAGLGYAIHSAAEFEQNMRNVNSISYMSEAQFRATSKAVIQLSKSMPTSANDLAKGLYDIASSGFQGAAGLEVLQASATAASAGMSTTANAAKAISAVLNAYGMGADHAKGVSDALFQTVNLGVVSFDELTGVIGDVVGTAAAASVDIGQVGAAIAAMTLSGLSGAESGTSLNRVLQSLIQPSDALATLYKQMGYESGSAALKAKGLHGVMEDLRKVTGGNIDALLALFPEIRSARGALALMSADGKNYSKTVDGIANAHNRAGATMKAFREQSKAVAFQFEIFRNRINAGVISLGAKLLPAVVVAMKLLGQFGSAMGDVFQRLKPFFDGVAQIGSDLVSILGQMARAAGPVVKVLGGLAALGIIETLNSIAGALADVTHFVANSEVAVSMLAAAITVALLPALYRMAAGLATRIFVGAVIGISNLIASFEGLTVAAAAAAAAEAAATLGVTALIGGLLYGFTKLDDAGKRGKEAVDGLYKNISHGAKNDPVKITAGIQTLNKELVKQVKVLDSIGTFDLHNPFSSTDPTGVATGKIEELQKKLQELERTHRHVGENLSQLAKDTGLSYSQLVQIADNANIDLTTGFDESNDARAQVIAITKKMEHQAGTSAKVMAKAVGTDIEAIQALSDEIAAVAKKTSEAFGGDVDLIGNFKVEKGHGSAARQLRLFFKNTEKEAGDFSSHIQQVTTKGLDPNIVSRLLQAGPKAAAPILEAMLSDHSGKLIKMANDSEEALQKINQKVVEFSRLTTLAVNSQTDKMAKDLGVAMRIASENMTQGAHATVESIARALHTDIGTVKRVAGEYGITIMTQAQAAINNHPLTIPMPQNLAEFNALWAKLSGPLPPGAVSLRDFAAGANPTAPPPVKKAQGGYVSGPGTGTSDSINARLSNGEFVVRAAAVRKIGLPSLNRMNYADGGMVHSARSYGSIDLGAQIAKAVAVAIASTPRSSLHVTVPADPKPNRFAGAVVDEAVFASRLGRL